MTLFLPPSRLFAVLFVDPAIEHLLGDVEFIRKAALGMVKDQLRARGRRNSGERQHGFGLNRAAPRLF